jgi:hypothetical protein
VAAHQVARGAAGCAQGQATALRLRK